jgi:exopolyphosphatase/guanosine-5'-triphosphate,3'-diphosphate pyrophosphatase
MIRSSRSISTPVQDFGQRAIIDIGSNTVRLVIYGGPRRAPTVLFNEKVTARLGKGVGETGRLGAKGMAAAHAALARFALLLKLRGVEDVDTVATAAVRDASNGRAFLDKITALGLAPRLLSGEEEAVASAHGVLSAFPGARGIVADLGGGSLELIDIADDAGTHGVSLPLGTLRLPAMRAEGSAKFSRRVAKMLRGADWAAHPGQTLYLVGGSLRALGRFAMVARDWPIDDPHGFSLSPDEALATTRHLLAKRATLAPISGVSASRLASLPDAAALLAVLVRELRPALVVFSGWGLREGLLAGGMDAAIARANPLIAGVSAFVEAQHKGLAAAAGQVAVWTAAANPNAPLPSAAGEPLRLAATMLALASVTTEPNLRAEQAAQWALRKRWLGVDAAGRAMIAMAVLANSAQLTIPDTLLRLAPLGALREAAAWGLATRLARRLSGGAGDVFDASSLSVVGRRLQLNLREDLAPLYTDATAKDLRIMADWLGLEPHFVAHEGRV